MEYLRKSVRKLLRVPAVIREKYYRSYNKLLFWAEGITYGKNLRVNNKVYLSGMGSVKIGDDFVCTSGNAINPISRNLQTAFFSAGGAEIKIGDRVGISSICLWANERITIGNDVNIGAGSVIVDNDAHPHDYVQRRRAFAYSKEPSEYQKLIPTDSVEIGNDVWVGANSIILKGVKIGENTIIAAGSVVVHDIPSNCIAGGNPCKVLKLIEKHGKSVSHNCSLQ